MFQRMDQIIMMGWNKAEFPERSDSDHVTVTVRYRKQSRSHGEVNCKWGQITKDQVYWVSVHCARRGLDKISSQR